MRYALAFHQKFQTITTNGSAICCGVTSICVLITSKLMRGLGFIIHYGLRAGLEKKKMCLQFVSLQIYAVQARF
jgi:hypothetical protein